MNGIILIDKQAGMTSRDVVDKVGKLLRTKQIGHTGTLDPMATGVLALCIGKATKISELITNYDKEYIATVTLGIETDTLDTEGKIINEVDNVEVSRKQVEEVLNGFLGTSIQEVPVYSAIKVKGKKLYEYARSNIEVELPKREINIYSISLLGDIEKDQNKVEFTFRCHVSKGTYIRSLIRDIGYKLGYPACMSSLRRIKQGSFIIDDCYKLEDIENNNYELLKTDEVLSDIEKVIVSYEIEQKIIHGAVIDKEFKSNISMMVNQDGVLLAIYKTYDKDKTKAKPYKMLITKQ
jgi:tRNA pseudouridine55 synthase